MSCVYNIIAVNFMKLVVK